MVLWPFAGAATHTILMQIKFSLFSVDLKDWYLLKDSAFSFSSLMMSVFIHGSMDWRDWNLYLLICCCVLTQFYDRCYPVYALGYLIIHSYNKFVMYMKLSFHLDFGILVSYVFFLIVNTRDWSDNAVWITPDFPHFVVWFVNLRCETEHLVFPILVGSVINWYIPSFVVHPF